MSTGAPPRFVPTLTDVVRAGQPQNNPPMRQSGHIAPSSTVQLEDQMVHRVMQRVDLVLERRLREAVAQVILAHTQSLGPSLREEIEQVVRQSVSQAIEQELNQQVQQRPRE